MQDRRRFLKVLGAAAGAAAVGCSGNDKASQASGPIAAGNVSQYEVGSLRAVSGAPVAVGRDSAGIYALSTICTHQQCDMATQGSISNSGLSCGCHGSRFDAQGNVLAGPASSPLQHWAVTIASDGSITVEGGQAVPASTRAPVSTG